MRKYTPYLIGFFVAAAVIILLLTSKRETFKRFDDRITLRKKDKTPYGLYVAYENLKNMFPGASVFTNKQEPGYWDSLSTYEPGQALIIISPHFLADDYELKRLMRFVESGNHVFISARQISDDAEKLFNCSTSFFGHPAIFREGGIISDDSMSVTLFKPPFAEKSVYSYPGYNFNARAYELDSSISEKLGGDDLNRVNFLHYRAGKGHLYLHLAPLAFSNYFLLHRDNIGYYEKVFSLISSSVNKVAWDEYYLRKLYMNYEDRNNEKRNWFNVLFRYPGLKAALLTAIFTLLLFVLIEMRRKQRTIPVIAKPKNDSLDFVKTIGRLYHDKGDHKNLCRKMSSYFLEYIRTRYNLLTNKLDADFVKSLNNKSGFGENKINEIVFFINYIEDAKKISAGELISFHKKLESFYQNA